MNYWHIVDALIITSYFTRFRNIAGRSKEKATANDVAVALVTILCNALFVAYLIHNIWPDVAGMVHGVSMCHG